MTLADIWQSLLWWRVWLNFGWREVRNSYKRAFIGAAWSPISHAATALVLTYIYGRFMGNDPDEYVLYLGTGFVCWQFINSNVTQAPGVFAAHAQLIRQIKTPYFSLVLKLVTKNSIIFYHNLFAYLFLLIFTGFIPDTLALLFLPGLVLCRKSVV